MAVTVYKLTKALQEAKRFQIIAEIALRKLKEDEIAEYGCKETGAVRRASMDLSRVLVGIRK